MITDSKPNQSAFTLAIFFFCLLLKILLFSAEAVAVPDFNENDTNGKIKGKIVDETTQAPLPAVNVMVEGWQLGTAADYDGNFALEQIPAGSYNIRFQMMGYAMRIISNVIVKPGRTTFMNIELKATILESEGVEVTAGYFHEAKDAVVSNRSMDFEEIRSDPGSAEDVQRVVQALPSVVSGSDQQNEIIVRGGMPGENLFVMDNIEIPNPNHFGNQGTGGGPINMVNTYFIRRVDFYAGAFPARYGDKASSVMDISLRDGNRERHAGHLYLGMSGAGAMAEGPLAGGKGAWILSARKSFLDLVISSTGLTAVPQYYSLQGKISYDLSPKNKLILNAIFGDDKIHIEEAEDAYSRGAENVRAQSRQYAFGGTLRTLFGDLGLSNLTISQTLNHWDQYVYDENDTPYYTNLSTEIERALKYDVTLLPWKRFEIDFGVAAKAVSFNHDEWFNPDTIFVYDTSVLPHQIIDIFATYPEWKVVLNENSYKVAGYAQTKLNPIPRLTVTAGIRYDYMHYINTGALDPRLGLSLKLGKGASFNMAVGRHSQSPAYVSLTSNPKNKSLDYKQTQQIVAGVDKLFAEDMRGSIEVFYKDYRNIPIPVSWLTPDPFDRAEGHLVNEGKGYSKGVEFFLQKKMSKNYYFTVSYAYSISQGFDPRFQSYYNWDYDYHHIFTLINGVRFDFRKYGWYAQLQANTLYKIFAWALPFADQMDVSVRWRYLGGRPYTKPIYYSHLHTWVVDETVPVNSHRFPAYHRLDFRLDRRFMFKGWNIVTYFDLMNVYGRDNIWQYSYKEDGSISEILQWKVFPVGGLAIEF
ncbi:MAG TPA: TonB-dependent receptor [bacterium]|nr:TonB-dependent receptor [bacterium]